MSNTRKDLDSSSWDGLLTNYLKADDVQEREAIIIPLNVRVFEEEGESLMELDVEYNKKRFVFNVNKTNRVFLKNNGVKAPKDVIGKKLFLEKTRAFNPSARKEVDALRIFKIE